jgi:putative spermidine/putrescine transport system permease protein
VVIAIFISGAYAVTLPKQMWDGIRISINPTIATVSYNFVCFTIVSIFTLELMERRMAKWKI